MLFKLITLQPGKPRSQQKCQKRCGEKKAEPGSAVRFRMAGDLRDGTP